VTLALYAVVLPQTIETALEPTMAGADVAWKSPLWFLRETIRGLQSGIPGGLVALAVVGGVLVAGVASFWKTSSIGTTVMLLPVVILVGVLAAMEHNLWPRLFFFLAGFAALIGIRGGFALCELVAGRFASRLGVVGASALILASATTVRGAWHPKQDYSGAARYVEQQKGPNDAVVTADLTAFTYLHYLAAPWDSVSGAAALTEIESKHARTWVVYAFPIRLASVDPSLWDRLQTQYRTSAVFRGTLGDGEVYVAVGPASGLKQETR
jgi:mannosyltransferase